MEVGIGLGTTLNKLQSCGYSIKGISPDLDQITQSNMLHTSFENYITTDTYNHILFQESAQYIDPSIIISKSYSLLEKQETELANETSNSHRHISEIDEELAKTQSKFL